MKRSLLIAALTTVAAGSALAQSSVTVWGRLNETVERQKVAGGENVTVLQNNASRLGFRGTEDLGGGLNAGFAIEHRFDADTGTVTGAAPFWRGQSEVFLGHNSVGTLRLGRFTSEAYYATADFVSLHNHDTGTSADALYYSAGGSNNKIGYRSGQWVPGLVFHAAVGLAEGAAGESNFRDFAATYDIGGLSLGAGYDAQGESNQFALRGMYTLGAFAFGGYYQRADDETLGKRNNVRLAGMYTLGASEFHLNAGLAGDWKNVTGGDSGAKQYTVGYNYNLSKRTKVYTFFTKLAADDLATEDDFQSFAIGVRHNF